MSRREVSTFDPQAAARSPALSTEAIPQGRRRRYVSAAHFVGVWLRLEAHVATARSPLGTQLDLLSMAGEAGLPDLGDGNPDAYDPADDLVESRDVLRTCWRLSQRGVVRLHRPEVYWLAWWQIRGAGNSQRAARSEINRRLSRGELSGEYVECHKTCSEWARVVDRVIEQELSDRRMMVRNAVGDTEEGR